MDSLSPASRPPAGPVSGLSLAQDSALAHCTGQARFADDLPEPPGTLHAALVLSDAAHGRLLSLDTDTARAMPGVVAVIGPRDIPGRNDVSPSHRAGEYLFAEETVEHWGQAIGMVVATTRDAAVAAAKAVRAAVEPLPPVLSVEEALSRDALLLPPMVLERGNPAAVLATAPHRVFGTFRCGGQEHFYLEGQIALAVPGEDGDISVHSSTQHPTEVQHIAARVLGCDFNRITVQVRRMGGGFGGKESNASWVGAAAALGAQLTGRPVKLRLARKADMAATGKRHPFLFRWTAGFDDTGRILALDALLAADGGHVLDLSTGVIFRAVTHALNVLDVADVRIDGRVAKTNTVSNTAFRGFGGPQGVLLMEDVVRHVARATGRTPEAVRERNFAGGPNGSHTPYGQEIEGDLIRRVWAEAREGSEWDRRRVAIDHFNRTHPFKRRGLGSFVLAFGISFGVMHMNQAGALVHVYADGSIRLNHGGTEMGQGLFIKVAQIVADVFGVPLSRIRITATSTGEVPNTSPTAASTGTDLNGMAAQIAATAIRDRMVATAAAEWGVDPSEVVLEDGQARAGNHALGFGELATLCHLKRVSLSATGFYRTPGIHWDPAAMRGEPFFYFSYGASVAEVEVDTLTGEHRCTAAYLVQDCGRSLNPVVDLGQIEGAFVQGLGWLTCEELFWDPQGRLRTLGPSTYKIPGSRDVPPDFQVKLLADAPARANTVFRSKAVGEPPLMLATAVWNALKDATGTEALDLPATPERVLLALRDASRRDVAGAPGRDAAGAPGRDAVPEPEHGRGEETPA
ncbi:xanthine dehydrogenase molybdopterin binding subunit [Roseomonas sp. BN140053]|uniref:xanthine dehydrogenase molybdopterin binding subunit n=1 Tax=Roseomonas sp. BN140053 TaxID=3391898 RepID=UPI0039EAE923